MKSGGLAKRLDWQFNGEEGNGGLNRHYYSVKHHVIPISNQNNWGRD